MADDIDRAGRQTGNVPFQAFLSRMARRHRERLDDILVMVEDTGRPPAAELTVQGTAERTYEASDDGLPPAWRQIYKLPGGAFLAIEDGLITHVMNRHDLGRRLRQIG